MNNRRSYNIYNWNTQSWTPRTSITTRIFSCSHAKQQVRIDITIGYWVLCCPTPCIGYNIVFAIQHHYRIEIDIMKQELRSKASTDISSPTQAGLGVAVNEHSGKGFTLTITLSIELHPAKLTST